MDKRRRLPYKAAGGLTVAATQLELVLQLAWQAQQSAHRARDPQTLFLMSRVLANLQHAVHVLDTVLANPERLPEVLKT